MQSAKFSSADQYASFSTDSHKKPQNNKVITGSLIAVGGGIMTYWGARIYSLEASQFNPNENLEVTGLIVAGAGVGLLVTGIAIAIAGNHRQHHKRVGLELYVPKSNEAGIAYRF